MPYLSPRLPINRNLITGYDLISDYVTLVKQNLKNLLLTVPGEKMMNPDFGIGLKRFLFENDDPTIYDSVASRIREQINKYLPYLEITDIVFNSASQDSSSEPNTLYVQVEYRIIPLELSDAIIVNGAIN
jgi:phage baseplate assembly protein W